MANQQTTVVPCAPCCEPEVNPCRAILGDSVQCSTNFVSGEEEGPSGGFLVSLPGLPFVTSSDVARLGSSGPSRCCEAGSLDDGGFGSSLGGSYFVPYGQTSECLNENDFFPACYSAGIVWDYSTSPVTGEVFGNQTCIESPEAANIFGQRLGVTTENTRYRVWLSSLGVTVAGSVNAQGLVSGRVQYGAFLSAEVHGSDAVWDTLTESKPPYIPPAEGEVGSGSRPSGCSGIVNTTQIAEYDEFLQDKLSGLSTDANCGEVIDFVLANVPAPESAPGTQFAFENTCSGSEAIQVPGADIISIPHNQFFYNTRPFRDQITIIRV